MPFGGGNKSYNMVVHNDYACFELTEDKIEGPNGGWIPLNIKDKINTDIAADAAMATGAFPVGLQARTVTRNPMYLKANPWVQNYINNTPLPPGDSYKTLNVDGGLINNEPFDRVRDVLNKITKQSIKDTNNPNKFTSTVLMIEPFPTKPPKPISLSENLGNVIGLTLSTMISQMRSKPIEIKNAVDEDCYAQYLITPSRIVTGPDEKTAALSGELAIACGALSGFSGFINKEFRVHDYFLGRFNCKIFLRDYFTVPADALENNPIFKNGYAGCDPEQFKSTNKENNGYQIIPVFADATDYTFPDFKFKSGSNWPILQDSDIDQYKDKLKARIQAAFLNIAQFNWFTKFLLWAGARLILNNLVANKIIATIKSDLKAWKLLPGGVDQPDFTEAQLKAAHAKVKTGADFPVYIQEIKELGLLKYEYLVADGRTVYYGANDYKVDSGTQYNLLQISKKSSPADLEHIIKIHQQGQTDFMTFCNQAANAGVEKWVIDTEKMTCTYYDLAGNKMVAEPIPEADIKR
jgi:uncharacterized protein YbcV (DUF1398 family)